MDSLLIRSTLRAEYELTPERIEQVMELFRREWARQDREREADQSPGERDSQPPSALHLPAPL